MHLLSNPVRINGVKSKGMRTSHEGKALVECNGYEAYMMARCHKAVMVTHLDHNKIMNEAIRCDVLEYKYKDDDEE